MITGIFVTVAGYGMYSAVKYHQKMLADAKKKVSKLEKGGSEGDVTKPFLKAEARRKTAAV